MEVGAYDDCSVNADTVVSKSILGEKGYPELFCGPL